MERMGNDQKLLTGRIINDIEKSILGFGLCNMGYS